MRSPISPAGMGHCWHSSASGPGSPFFASQVLGFGAIIAGLGPLGAIILAGGSSISTYSALGETRIAEASADQAALTYLERAHISGRGLISFFEREFVPQERAAALAYRTQPVPYFRTHPLSEDRLRYLSRRVQRARYYGAPTSTEQQQRHDMVRAKLYGFSKSPELVLKRYPPSDRSLAARYARAVMFAYRRPNRAETLQLIDALIAENAAQPLSARAQRLRPDAQRAAQ